jgi:hypothetical protein
MTLFVESASMAEQSRTVPLEGICQLYLGFDFEKADEY